MNADDLLNLKIVLILTVGFSFASLLGYFSQKAKLSPLLGYLVAGYLIGPYSPGFVADLKLAEQLAEIGVILMMFGVGLHFKWQDLARVKKLAIPGAIGQTVVATAMGALLIYSLGWSLEAGIIFGLAIGVASTVVLVRVLSSHKLLQTQQGHVAVGWLLVEDVITVAALLLLPTLAVSSSEGHLALHEFLISISISIAKFVALVALVFWLGRGFIQYVLSKVIQIQSHELFTLTILALTFIIATGSTLLFGTSLALGAFLAGMVIGQTNARKKAFSNIQSLQDTFVAIFFLSIGMLFNPVAIVEHFLLFLSVLAIILFIKPLTAFFIAKGLNYSDKTALTVAIGLAQIGEFSFILGEQASKLTLLPDECFDVLVACALISIAINPIIFKWICKDSFEQPSLTQ